MTIEAKLNSLYKKVTGYRELMKFEDTFGPTFEELNNISPMSRWVVRILAETEFALRLSKVMGGRHDGVVEKTVEFLLDAVNNDGNLTNSICRQAEEMLMEVSKDAKEYALILCGHAHIDMDWMWGYNETVSATVSTFSTMLDIMDEYPDFCFSQSQASVYEIIDKFAPELHDRIKQRIDEGRWEVTASAWVETDKNMPSTESLLRHIKYTKNYMRDNWGVDPDNLEVDFSPDTFGHSANLPELDTYGGVKYYYHCRALKEPYALYRWKGQSGKELLMYCEQHWYNSAITPKIGLGLLDISERSAGFKTGLIVYGVGDHGGGPTRRDVNRAIEMMEWPIFPKLKFGTFREFFKKAETVRSSLPLVDHELNFLLTGCYTTQSRIKYGNRMSEKALSDSETVSALAEIYADRKMNAKNIEKAWQNVLFTHFHDILTGACYQDSREHAMGLYQEALSYANTEFMLALRALAENTDTSWVETEDDLYTQAIGAGAGYPSNSLAGRGSAGRGGGKTRIINVYNPTGVNKKELAEITVWDYPGDLRYLSIKDSQGREVEFQLADTEKQRYWDHMYFRFYAMLEIPALSYETLVITEKEKDKCGLYLQHNWVEIPSSNHILENEFIRCEIDYTSGEIISLYDKKNNKELIREGETAGLELVDSERRSSSAYAVGKYMKRHKIDNLERMGKVINGELRNAVEFEAVVKNSRITVKYSLDKNDTFIRCNIVADWCEQGEEKIPVLIYSMPVSYKAEKYMYNIPLGAIVRQPEDRETPGLSYIQALDKDNSNAGIITDCKYGFRGKENEIIVTLINTSVAPDKYPERSVQTINLAIGVFDGDAKATEETAQSFNRPLVFQSTTSHSGALPPMGTFIDFDADTAVLSAVYTEDGMTAVRVYSVADRMGTVKIGFMKDVHDVYLCNLMGEKIDGEVKTSGGMVEFEIQPRTVMTVKVKV